MRTFLDSPATGSTDNSYPNPATCARAPQHLAPTWIAIGTVETASALAMASQGHAFVEARFHSSERAAEAQRGFARRRLALTPSLLQRSSCTSTRPARTADLSAA